MRKIEAVILDWSGTIVDYGCMATEENYREIFEDFGIHLTTKEISKILKEPESTIRNRISRAKIKLKNLYKGGF